MDWSAKTMEIRSIKKKKWKKAGKSRPRLKLLHHGAKPVKNAVSRARWLFQSG